MVRGRLSFTMKGFMSFHSCVWFFWQTCAPLYRRSQDALGFLSVGYLNCLVPVCPGVLLNRVTSASTSRTVELGHWLLKKREAQRSFDMVASRLRRRAPRSG